MNCLDSNLFDSERNVSRFNSGAYVCISTYIFIVSYDCGNVCCLYIGPTLQHMRSHEANQQLQIILSLKLLYYDLGISTKYNFKHPKGLCE